MNKEVSIIPLSYGNYVSLEDYLDLKKQLEEKQKIIDKLLRKYNEETCTIDFSMTIEDFNQLLEILERGNNE